MTLIAEVLRAGLVVVTIAGAVPTCVSIPTQPGALIVTWDAYPSTVDGYVLERRAIAGTTWGEAGRPAGTTVVDTLEAGSYCYRVRTRRGLEVSAPSPEVCGCTAR